MHGKTALDFHRFCSGVPRLAVYSRHRIKGPPSALPPNTHTRTHTISGKCNRGVGWGGSSKSAIHGRVAPANTKKHSQRKCEGTPTVSHRREEVPLLRNHKNPGRRIGYSCPRHRCIRHRMWTFASNPFLRTPYRIFARRLAPKG